MKTMTATEVRKNWREVVAAALAGQEIAVTRRGKPVATFCLPPKMLFKWPQDPLTTIQPRAKTEI